MLDTIPQDQTFTQLIITQMVTYYDKCFGLYKGISYRLLKLIVQLTIQALVTRAQSQAQGGIRPKTAAALVEAGESREIVTQLWQADSGESHDLLSKVCKSVEALAHVLIESGKYPTHLANQ